MKTIERRACDGSFQTLVLVNGAVVPLADLLGAAIVRLKEETHEENSNGLLVAAIPVLNMCE